MGIARIYALTGNPLLNHSLLSAAQEPSAQDTLNPAHVPPVPTGYFAALNANDKALVDQQVEKLLHAAWQTMNKNEPAAPAHYQGISFHFGVADAMRSALKSGTIGLYVATYVNNMRESMAHDTAALEGLRTMEEITQKHTHLQTGTGH